MAAWCGDARASVITKKSVPLPKSFLIKEDFGPYPKLNSPRIPPTFWVEMVSGGSTPPWPRPSGGACESEDVRDENEDEDDNDSCSMVGREAGTGGQYVKGYLSTQVIRDNCIVK